MESEICRIPIKQIFVEKLFSVFKEGLRWRLIFE